MLQGGSVKTQIHVGKRAHHFALITDVTMEKLNPWLRTIGRLHVEQRTFVVVNHSDRGHVEAKQATHNFRTDRPRAASDDNPLT